MPITLPFGDWKRGDAEKVIPKLEAVEVVNVKFFDGDHWQDGAGWLGPMPMGAAIAGQELVAAEIEKAFTSKNVVAEVVNRHMRGVIGREPGWAVVLDLPDKGPDYEPTDADNALVDEAEALLLKWWNERKAQGVFQVAVTTLLLTKRSHLRLFVPPGLLEASDGGATVVNAVDEEDALRYIHLGHPDPKTATVYTDPKTGWKVSVVLLEQDGQKVAEVSFQDPVDATLTTLRILSDTGAKEYPGLQLKGQPLLFEMSRPLLVTKQAQAAQRALNLALSMLPRNVVTGGFLERVILNGMMPGEWVEQADGTRKFKPDPMLFGAGVVNWIQGIDLGEDEKSGAKTLTEPTIQWRDPVPVDSPISAKNEHYKDMLDEVDQAHVLLNSQAESSGRSREQARADYESSLERTRVEVEAAGRWLLTSVLALAELFGSTPGKYTNNVRVDFVAHLDAGPISVEERAQNVTEMEAGLLSKPTAMSRNGVDDPDAEMGAMAGQEDAELGLRERQFTVMEIGTRAGMTVEQAGKLAGLTEEDLKVFTDAGPEGDGTGTPGAPPTPFPVVQ